MPSHRELWSQLNTDEELAHDLVAYRPALGERLVALREAGGYSLKQAAKLAGVRPETLKFYEEAVHRPSMPRLIRLMTLYDADPMEFLAEIASTVRPQSKSEPVFQRQVEALLYFCGVTPEQMADGKHQVHKTGRTPAPITAPLGEVLKGRRDDHPARVQGGLLLRREYEAGASIRALSDKHRLAFGTIRALLVEANTQLRGPGRAHGTA
ncbi:Helix-turn-helix domain-containing protein [Lentzea albidocapillata subsp. violacea]|uniref:Helix-turn-helix domain-containing protein n=2 Tax=Lentzea albidocapillata TaxID=40571 RepID=A0A1G9P1A8_9PSEU|nr:Helix-turn-helix domain-containing protein [Lentzea albidocapillata subsp. violacea]